MKAEVTGKLLKRRQLPYEGGNELKGPQARGRQEVDLA